MMSAQNSVSYIISVLKGEKPQFEPDWFEVVGFLFVHKIAGLFYSKAKQQGVHIPKKVDFLLRDVFEKQARSVACKREYINKISAALVQDNVNCAFLKGSVLSNIPFGDKRIYVDGERVSNDIDILVSPSEITSVANVLKGMGFVQGEYDRVNRKIVEFSRMEIIKRRMTRGEVAPFVKLTGNVEFPFIEIDLNFSLGNTPEEGQDLLRAIIDSAKFTSGEISMYVPDKEMFFIHLIMHQYKESCLYFMVQRSKELDVYKLADMYYLLKANAVDVNVLDGIIRQYGIASCAGAVLKQVGDVFDDDRVRQMAQKYGVEQPVVIDYESKKHYKWQADINERIRVFSAIDLLNEVEQC